MTDIINYQYTTPKANELEILRSYDQSILNIKNGSSNISNIINLSKYKKTPLKK